MSSDSIDRQIQVGSDTGLNDIHRYIIFIFEKIVHIAAGSQ